MLSQTWKPRYTMVENIKPLKRLLWNTWDKEKKKIKKTQNINMKSLKGFIES